ncbi:MAG: PAS domain-containing protein [Deltaproteobacteria bacterium]|nr:PAS domain-containing protein [Deltaproteobacteria bacterium]MBN2670208.1 PAS domain-containing protein [Deltaproteobacteria bacterium]
MKTAPSRSFRFQTPPSPLASVVESETKICKFKFGIFAIFLAYFLFFPLLCQSLGYSFIYPILITGALWILINALVFTALRRDRFHPWMTWGAALSDVAHVALINFFFGHITPLNYSDNLIVSFYFIAIALVAVRKDTRLAYIVGFGSAAVYLGISVYFQIRNQTGSYTYLYFNGKVVASMAFLDQLAKAFAIAVTAWVVAHVTQRIRLAQKKYQTLFDNVPDGIVLTNSMGTVETINRSFLEMVDEPISEIIGKPVNNLFAAVYQRNQNNEMVTQRTSSTSIPVAISEASVWPQKDNTQKILSIRNLSMHQELRDQVTQAQKTEALGQIARGLAHDFNNLLGGILGAVSLIRVKLGRLEKNGNNNKLRMHTQLIQDCAENARDILKRLLALSRASERHSTSFDLRNLLNDLRDFTQKTFGDLYEVIFTDEVEDVTVVDGDESSVFQALLNICLNAKEAMPAGGRIRILLSEADPARLTQISNVIHARGVRYLHVRISDLGTGMSVHVQKHCMEPFFSTKETVRRGAGLGLSIANNIIRNHNGILHIASTSARGTSIDVFLSGSPKRSAAE